MRGPALDLTLAIAGELGFARVARTVGDVCDELHIVRPTMRQPPADPTVNRSLKRHGEYGPIIAVRIAGRPTSAVVDDLVAGVAKLAALAPGGPTASQLRARVLEDLLDDPHGGLPV